MSNKLLIRFASITDLPSIVEIYNQAIRTNIATGDIQEFTIEERTEWFKKFDANKHPIYIAEMDNKVIGYCTLSPYRSGRKAMSSIAEISYYLNYSWHERGIGTELLKHTIIDCHRIGITSLLAILLDINTQSIAILEKLNFKKWGHFPDVINLNGITCGQFIYGLKLGGK